SSVSPEPSRKAASHRLCNSAIQGPAMRPSNLKMRWLAGAGSWVIFSFSAYRGVASGLAYYNQRAIGPITVGN
ncbi:MAG: hypothetical protein ACREYC_13070, partial [Gammaproteobacteria bacterium]